MQKKNDRRETCGAKIPPRAMSLHLRVYTRAAVYTRVYGPSPFLRLRHEFRLTYSFFLLLFLQPSGDDGDHARRLIRDAISLVSNDFPFSVSLASLSFLFSLTVIGSFPSPRVLLLLLLLPSPPISPSPPPPSPSPLFFTAAARTRPVSRYTNV